MCLYGHKPTLPWTLHLSKMLNSQIFLKDSEIPNQNNANTTMPAIIILIR